MGHNPHNNVRRILLVALVGFIAFACLSVSAEPPDGQTKALFCAYGGIGATPKPLPPGFESEFAEAVFEVNGRETKNASVTGFTLFDDDGKTTTFKRVVGIEVFDEPYVEGEGNFGYYLNNAPGSRSHPWDGTLPGGMIHLRVRVALMGRPIHAVRFRLTIGQYVVEGPVDGSWAT